MRVAVCIQNDEIRARLRTLFDSYGAQKGSSLECLFFENDMELLCDLIGGEYDAVFLDLFDNMGGLISEIREKDKLARLICVVSNPQWALDNYGKDIWYSLPAPVSEAFLFSILDRVDSDIKHDSDAGIVVKSRRGIVRLSFSSIEYVEVINKTVCFHLLGQRTQEVTSSLAEYEPRLLQWPDFIKVHRAYIVNLRHIQKLESGNILTSGGHSIPVSRHLFPQLKKDYMCKLMDPDVDSKVAKEYKDSVPDPPKQEVGEGYSILLVDDEQEQRARWSKVLSDNGCSVQTAKSGKVALELAEHGRFDCVVLDVKLGADNGFDLCAGLVEKTGAPVVFLSSLADSESQMRGFLAGGIDYVTKDTTGELFWLKVQTRIKMAKVSRAELCDHSLRLDLKNRKVFLRSQEVSLTTVEFDLLCLMMQNPGTVYTPARLYGMIWGVPQWDGGETMQLHLSQLRRKLESVFPNHSFIETVWGKGYCFVSEE